MAIFHLLLESDQDTAWIGFDGSDEGGGGGGGPGVASRQERFSIWHGQRQCIQCLLDGQLGLNPFLGGLVVLGILLAPKVL